MIRNQRLEIAAPIINRVSIISRLSIRQRIAVLPEHISSNGCRVQGCDLPWSLDSSFVSGNTVFLQDTRLADFSADGTVVRDPR